MASLIPIPASMQRGQGNFILKKTATIVLSSEQADVARVADFLSKKLSAATGFAIPVKSSNAASNAPGIIKLAIINNTKLGKEGYNLNVTPGAVSISADKPEGLFYGMQTLLQLFPKEIESKTVVSKTSWTVPAVSITDSPGFGWRGMLFDVSRHFFTNQQVKDFIDNIVQYKYNLLHLHLTDDQGWRIEIKSLPNLTKVGAWRPKREGAWGNTKAPDPSEPKTLWRLLYTRRHQRDYSICSRQVCYCLT
ncbi:MAG: glycoside hydrolase family 20 zincin-like fold domain-containing protein [Segetibacter sp.]